LPRVLKLLGGVAISGNAPIRKHPLSSYGKRIAAVLIRTEERLAREKAEAAAKRRKASTVSRGTLQSPNWGPSKTYGRLLAL
jgi:hypothetical protein